MESVQKGKAASCNPIFTLGGRVKQGTSVTVLLALALGAGLFFGWDSVVAVGMSSLVLSLLPCLAICSLGVCASRMGKKNGKEC